MRNPASLLVDIRGKAVGIDATGNLRTANPFVIADLINKYNIDPREFGTLVSTGGSVTHVPASSAAALAVTGSNGSRALLRTHTYFKYQSAKASRIRQSVYHTDTGQSNQIRRWGGLFDDNDGLFFQLTGTTLQVVRRTSTNGSPVDNTIDQSNWNVDKLDGTGPSGITIDITKGNIYETNYEWLGVGLIRFFVNGALCHEMQNPNSISGPYMRTGTLPISVEVVNTGASAIGGLNYICASVMVEGGEIPPFYGFGTSLGTAVTVGSTSEIPVLSIRPTLTFNSITNRMLVLPTSVQLGSKSNGLLVWRLIMNGTLTSPSYASVGTQSGVEMDTTASAIVGGETLQQGFATNPTVIDLRPFFDFLGRKLRTDAFATAGAQDTLTLAAQSDSGNIAMRAGFTWQEIR